VAGLAKLGFMLENQDTGEAVPWRDIFPEVQDNMPGTVLSGARTKAGFTQVQLAEQSGVPQRHISEMEHGKRTIGKDRARRLASVLDIPYQTLL
jgi:plasmid maintenance system antidote protein VapI